MGKCVIPVAFFAVMRIIHGTPTLSSKTPGWESLQDVLQSWSIQHQQPQRQRKLYTHKLVLLKSDAVFVEII